MRGFTSGWCPGTPGQLQKCPCCWQDLVAAGSSDAAGKAGPPRAAAALSRTCTLGFHFLPRCATSLLAGRCFPSAGLRWAPGEHPPRDLPLTCWPLKQGQGTQPERVTFPNLAPAPQRPGCFVPGQWPMRKGPRGKGRGHSQIPSRATRGWAKRGKRKREAQYYGSLASAGLDPVNLPAPG